VSTHRPGEKQTARRSGWLLDGQSLRLCRKGSRPSRVSRTRPSRRAWFGRRRPRIHPRRGLQRRRAV